MEFRRPGFGRVEGCDPGIMAMEKGIWLLAFFFFLIILSLEAWLTYHLEFVTEAARIQNVHSDSEYGAHFCLNSLL